MASAIQNEVTKDRLSEKANEVDTNGVLKEKVGEKDAVEEVEQEDQSSSGESNSDMGQGDFETFMIAEANERLRLAMHHLNQHRRLDTKIVTNFAYQLYCLISCMAWLIIPTLAGLLASYAVDVMVKRRQWKMYKNYGMIGFNTLLWVYGFWRFWRITADIKQTSGALSCLGERKWRYEDKHVTELLTSTSPLYEEEEEEQKVGPCDVGRADVKEVMEEPEERPAEEKNSDMNKTGNERTLDGAAGDNVTKDKDI